MHNALFNARSVSVLVFFYFILILFYSVFVSPLNFDCKTNTDSCSRPPRIKIIISAEISYFLYFTIFFSLLMPRLLSPDNYKYYPLDSVRTDALGKSAALPVCTQRVGRSCIHSLILSALQAWRQWKKNGKGSCNTHIWYMCLNPKPHTHTYLFVLLYAPSFSRPYTSVVLIMFTRTLNNVLIAGFCWCTTPRAAIPHWAKVITIWIYTIWELDLYI